MEKIITYETLRNFAYSNDLLIESDIKGIVMMLISVAVVYLIAFLLNYYIIKKEAEGINIALEKHNKRNQ